MMAFKSRTSNRCNEVRLYDTWAEPVCRLVHKQGALPRPSLPDFPVYGDAVSVTRLGTLRAKGVWPHGFATYHM